MTQTILFAQPYNMDATGFYFKSESGFTANTDNLLDRFGCKVEEFEIQFIDGNDAALFDKCSISQANLGLWFDDIETMETQQKAALFLLIDLGYTINNAMEKLDDVCLAECDLAEASAQLFDDCYLSSIPDNLHSYIDYDAFAHDLKIGGEMYEFELNGTTYTCTNSNNI